MVKVISLSEKAYGEMKHLKRRGESFSDIVLRLIGKHTQPPLSEFFGIWSNEEADRVKEMIEKDRKHFKTREVTF